MLKKLTKNVTVATALLSSMTGGNFVAAKESQLNSVQQYADKVHSLAKREASVEEVFIALSNLTTSIEKVTTFLEQKKFKLPKSSFNTLLAIRQLLDINSSLLIAKYEANILSAYRNTYRQYSVSLKHLDDAIYNVREKLGTIEVVEVKDLSLTQDDLNKIHHQAKTRVS